MTKQSHFTKSLIGACHKKISIMPSEQFKVENPDSYLRISGGGFSTLKDCFADSVKANLPLVKGLPQLRLAMTGLGGVL
jgi:hypothetical protein